MNCLRMRLSHSAHLFVPDLVVFRLQLIDSVQRAFVDRKSFLDPEDLLCHVGTRLDLIVAQVSPQLELELDMDDDLSTMTAHIFVPSLDEGDPTMH